MYNVSITPLPLSPLAQTRTHGQEMQRLIQIQLLCTTAQLLPLKHFPLPEPQSLQVVRLKQPIVTR